MRIYIHGTHPKWINMTKIDTSIRESAILGAARSRGPGPVLQHITYYALYVQYH